MAAKTAAKNNLNTVLIDDKSILGGTTLFQQNECFKINNSYSNEWLKKEIETLNSFNNLTIKTRTTLAAYHSYNYLLARENLTDHLDLKDKKDKIRQRLWKIRAKKVIIATGAMERPLIFDNNDRPGIILSSSIKKYIDFYGVKCGQKISLFTNNDSAYETAISLNNRGVSVNSVVDIRDKTNSLIVKQVEKLGIKIHWKSSVINTNGYKKINSIEIMKLSDDGTAAVGKKINEECDCLGISGGWTPRVHLFTQSGGKLKFRDKDNVFLPDKSELDQISIGSCNGDFELDEVIKNSVNLINKFLKVNNNDYENLEIISSKEIDKKNIWLLPSDKPLGKTKQFLDFQNDSTANDVKLALREGFKSIEHVKRYTTTGMATDQGKIGNINALGIISSFSKIPIHQLGTTTYRLPYTPITFGAIAGRNVKKFFDVERTTPMHSWHIDNGAKFEDVGQWKRAWYYPINGEDIHQAVSREVKATRDGIGILDASTLGKIDIKGRDASEFLNRVYTNSWSKLAIGKCRYGIMLGDDGMVIDDGVTSRLDENHYVMTTTTGNAASVMGKLEDWLQTEWPELKVYLTSITEQFATISINGPYSSKLMGKLCSNFDFSNQNFPHMSLKKIKIDEIDCRVMRISFTGEKCFEINVPSSYAKSLWKKCFELGKQFNITPYGTEAMHVLRAEKGFVIVGQETDGSVTPLDLDMSWIVNQKKYDFIGKRALSRSDTMREDRKQLVGILTKDPNIVLEEGAQLVEKISKPPMNMIGHVTSSYYSPNLKRSIALALVRDGLKKKGQTVYAPMPNQIIELKISDPVFIDPNNERLSA